MRRCINVYSLPRSGTNVFSGYLMQHAKIISHNVAGGRHPFRANFGSTKYEIFSGSGAYKIYDLDCYYLRDELKFSFIGPRKTWPEQLLFKLYEHMFRSMNKRVVLMRNPYAIAASMYDYQLKNSSHNHVWDVSKKDQLIKFVSSFSKMIKKSKVVLKTGGIIIDPYLFFTQESMKLKLFDFLGLNISDLEKVEICKNGHKFEVIDNQLTCPCGKLEGFGGFNPLLQINADRLLTNKIYTNADFLTSLNYELDSKLGEAISSCFNQSGITDIDSLLTTLN